MARWTPFARYVTWLIGLLILAFLAASQITTWSPANRLVALSWLAGAAGFGFVGGYTTGASKQTGTAAEFLKLLSTGVIIPLVGGIVGIVQRGETTTEKYEYEAVGTLKSKTTETTYSETGLPPLVLFGLFLAVYGLFAVLGIMLGSSHRKNDIADINIIHR